MIALCDIGQSGLKSLQRAFEAAGFMAVITSSPEEISRCSHAVLSYGGSFASGFEALRKTRLDRTLRAAAAAGKPVLFIGTGMLLACRSCNQNGLYKGMALLPFDAVGANRETEGFFSTKVTPCALFDRAGRQHFYYRFGAYVSPYENSAPEAQAEEPAPAVNVWETVPSGQHAKGESGASAELRAENTAASDADGTGTERESLRRKNAVRGIGPVIAAAVAGSVCATAFYPHKSGREGLEVLRRFAQLPPRSLAGAEPLTAATAEGMPDFGLIARIDVINGRTQDGRPCCMQAEELYNAGADGILLNSRDTDQAGLAALCAQTAAAAGCVFVPLYVSGAIHDPSQLRVFLDEGADRVFYGKASIRSQYRIERAVHAESSGGIGVSLACRAIPGTDSFEVLVDGENGSGSGKDAFLWAFHAQRLGASGLLLRAIPNKGESFDIKAVRQILSGISCPVILSGDLGDVGELAQAAREGVLASADKNFCAENGEKIKNSLREMNIPVRLPFAPVRQERPEAQQTN